jgi:hypothetical protein
MYESNKSYKRMSKGLKGCMSSEDYLRTRKMCITCKFFIDEQCSKRRVIRRCAEQGLKNKE